MRKWLEASPRDSDGWYDLACAYARLGEKDNALDALESAADAGFKDAEHIKTDADLESLRSETRFRAVLERMAQSTRVNGPVGFIRHFAPMKTIGTYIVMLPSDYQNSTKTYPLCVILHGSGSSELNHGKLADNFGREGVIYLAVRAPHPHPEAPPCQGWTAWAPDMIPDTDAAFEGNRLAYVEWIMDCVRDVQKQYRVQSGKIFIYGHSQGGQFAMTCALLYPERVASIFDESGTMPKTPSLTPENLAKMKEQNVQVHLLHGQDDKTVPPDTSKKLADILHKAGIVCALQMMPGEHVPTPDMIQQVRDWINTEVRAK